jgi:hypothetical protein
MFSKKSHKITSLTLALLIFISSSGVSLDLHFCQGTFKSFSIYGKAKNCHKLSLEGDKKKPTCKHHSAKATQKEQKYCCKNHTFVIKRGKADATSHVIHEYQDFQFDYFNIPPNREIINIEIFEYLVVYVLHKPPLPKKDYQVLFQTFII